MIEAATTDVATIEEQATTAARDLLATATMLVVRDARQAVKAADLLTAVTRRRKAIEEWFKPLVDAAHRAHKALTQRRADVVAKFAEPEGIIRGKLASYQQQQEQLRRDAERAALEAARAEAERQRYLKAEQAMDRGELERAERILEAPPPPVVMPAVAVEEPAKLEGVSFQESWSVIVDDPMALIRAVADGTAPINLVVPNEQALRGMVRSLKAAFAVPGCRAVCDKVARVTT